MAHVVVIRQPTLQDAPLSLGWSCRKRLPASVETIAVALDSSVSSKQSAESQDRLHRVLCVGAAALVSFAIAFPRSAAAIFLVPVLFALMLLLVRGDRRALPLAIGPLPLALLTFAGWSLLSATWSAAPLSSLSKPLFLVGSTIGVVAFAMLARTWSAAALSAIGLGIAIGLALGGGFLCIEALTDQALTRFAMNMFPGLRAGQEKHLAIENGVVVTIAENSINRRTTIVTMLLLPVALLASSLAGWRARIVVTGAVVAIAVILLFASGHQSSQAAIVAGGLGFLLVRALGSRAVWLVGAAWCVSCLFVIPIVMALHDTNLHKQDKGLFLSARHRMVIWNYTAEQVRKAPLFGVGADATAAITEARTRERERLGAPPPTDGVFQLTAARHAHNVFLQVWYELGAVGAIILTAVGVAALAAARGAPAAARPFLIGQFAAIAGMIAFSFSVWQLWFQGAIGLGVVALLTGICARAHREAPPPVGSTKPLEAGAVA